MVDIIKIDNEQFREMRGWASERTLASLLSATEKSNELLKAIGGKRTGGVNLAQTATRAQKGLQNVSDELDNTQRAAQGFNESLKELEETQWKFSSKTKGLIDKLQSTSKDASRLIPELVGKSANGLTSAMSGVAGIFGKKGKAAGVWITAIGSIFGAAATKAAERFIEAADSFRPMIQSGITFGGSIDQMVASVRGAGVSFETAGKIVDQQGSMLVAVGEKNFFAATDRMGGTFKRLGLTGDQGAEILAELTDQLRTTGSVYNMSQDQIIQANETSLRLMQQQSILTGKSLKQQIAERKTMAERQSFQLMLSGQAPEEAARLQDIASRMRNQGINEDMVMGILMQAKEVSGTRSYGQAQVGMGELAGQLVEQIQSGAAAKDIDQLTQQAGLTVKDFLQSTWKTGVAALESNSAGLTADLYKALLPILDPTRIREAAEKDATKAEQARKAAEGIDILGQKTQFYYDTIFDVSKKIAQVEAKAFQIVSDGIDKVLASIIKAADQINAKGLLETAQDIAGMPGLASLGAAAGLAAAPNLLGLGAGAAASGAAASGAAGVGGAAAGSGSMWGKAFKIAGKVAGIDQLVSAGTNLWEGNYGAAAAHAGLFLAKKNPVGLTASIADALTEAITGKGLIDRMFSTDPQQQIQQQIQQSMQAAAAAQVGRGDSLTPPNIPQQGTLSREQATALEAYTQNLAVRLGELQMQGLDQRNQAYQTLLQEMVNNTRRVEEAIKGLDR